MDVLAQPEATTPLQLWTSGIYTGALFSLNTLSHPASFSSCTARSWPVLLTLAYPTVGHVRSLSS